MKLTQVQLSRIVEMIFNEWKKNNIVTFKEDERKIFSVGIEYLKKELQKEVDLEKEVNQMLDKLEKSNTGEFQRYKMYPMLKQKLAKERKVVL